MPKIIRDSAQDKALAEIEKDLLVIKEINEILQVGYSGSMVIVSTPDEGKKVKASIKPENRQAILLSLVKEKKTLVKQIMTKAKRFKIELSDEDMDDLRDLEVQKYQADVLSESGIGSFHSDADNNAADAFQ